MSLLTAEIAEQPAVLARLLDAQLPRLDAWRAALRRGEIDGVVVVARGSSDNAARYAQYLWSLRTGLPVALATPSLHTVYGGRIDVRGKAVVALSQSGASPDVVAVLAAARDQGSPAVAITNDPTHRWHGRRPTCWTWTPVPSARWRRPRPTGVGARGRGAGRWPWATRTTRPSGWPSWRRYPEPSPPRSTATRGLDAAAEVLAASMRGVVVGRGLNLGTAFEAALKLTELTGSLMAPYSPADLLHGPVAAVGPDVPVLALAPDEPATASVLDAGPRGGAARVPGRDGRAGRRPRPGRRARPAAARSAGRTVADAAAGRRPGPAPRSAGRGGPRHRRGPSRRSDEGDSHDLIAGTPGAARSFYGCPLDRVVWTGGRHLDPPRPPRRRPCRATTPSSAARRRSTGRPRSGQRLRQPDRTPATAAPTPATATPRPGAPARPARPPRRAPSVAAR